MIVQYVSLAASILADPLQKSHKCLTLELLLLEFTYSYCGISIKMKTSHQDTPSSESQTEI